MRKTIHLPNDQSSNYSSSDEVEPLGQGQVNFQKGMNKLVLPIKLREDMKTMRENNSLYLYQPGGDELAVIKITVLNDSGVFLTIEYKNKTKWTPFSFVLLSRVTLLLNICIT